MAAMFEGLLGGGGPQGGKEQSVSDKHWERLVTLRTQKVNGKVDGWKPKTDDDILTCLHTSRRRKRESRVGFVQNVYRGNVGGKGYLHLFMKGINFNISCIALW